MMILGGWNLLLCGLALAASAKSEAQSAAPDNRLTLWTRHAGAYSDDQNPTQSRPRTLTFDKAHLVLRRIYDAQYGKTSTYRGIPLADLLAAYARGSGDDLAILHFANGMAVPVPLDQATLDRLDAFVAVAICSPKMDCGDPFPEVAKEDAFSVMEDPRPITFGWNKLVVPTLWHPDVPEERKHIFTPWHHVDTLTGVEYVNSEAYYRQFDLGEPEGQQVFRERCQYCHAARFVGARFGWDFVTPLPIYQKRPPGQLLNHVKYPKARAKSMGLMMPNQSDVTDAEMQAIWRWMKRAAGRTLPRYQP